jgi:hypothetical protein
MIKIKNKKAVSEVISYVLLIVIAMSLATGVYAWMKFYVPSEKEEKCADDTAISIIDYNCLYNPILGGPENKKNEIRLTISNQGFFEVDGFFITASDALERPPYQSLNATLGSAASGRWDFSPKLAPGNTTQPPIQFSFTGLNKIARVKIQPYKSGTKALLACPYIAEIRPENC